MPDSRIDKLLDAYFHQPIREYVQVLSEIKRNGGLTSEEVGTIEKQVLFVHARTIVRQSRVSTV